VVLYLGRLDPEKRVPALVDTFLSLGLPDDHVLCLAGDGIQRDRLRRRAAGHPNIRVLGLVSDARKLELLRGCDVFVLPSTAEGLALSLLEAMAAGCAIVATDAGEDGSALHDAGLVIPANPLRPALDDALRQLISDRALRAHLGEAARARAVGCFAGAGSADRVLGVYADAARSADAARGTPAGAALP
jgi:glycosyltransferase involved in cell wall biosynthesis